MGLDYEQLLIFNELSEIIRWQNLSMERMKSFCEKYPYLIPPNVARMVEENLKENVQILYRELNDLHKPREQRKRHVCSECHGVFFVSLPGGICDECRSKKTSHKPQYGRVASPRREGEAAQTEEVALEGNAEAPENMSSSDAAPAQPEDLDELLPKEDD